MTAYFVDTSASVKRYITERGSTWVRGWIEPSFGHVILISELATVETVSALAKRRRIGDIAPHAELALRNDFLIHLQNDEYLVVNIDSKLLVEARNLVVKHDAYSLRSLDAIHLAGALYARNALQTQIVFVAADGSLFDAAKAEGFRVEDPNNYP